VAQVDRSRGPSNADGSDPTIIGDPDAFDVEPKVSPDGTSVLFVRLAFPGDQQRQTLMIRDLATGTERVIDATGTAVEHPAWSPDGRWIAYDINPNYGAAVPNDQVMRIAADGSGKPTVLFEATAESGGFKPNYSPDGSRIVFGCFHMSAEKDVACLMDADGSNVSVLVDDPNVHENHFAWGRPAP
jgi:Tol biopolymer transport system component